MLRRVAVLIMIVLVAGCAQDLPDSARIPHFQGKPVTEVAVGVTDHRSFILDNDKEEWFEGITRGGFGIPMSLQRPGDEGEKPFAVYLSGMIKESLEKAGAQVSVVKLEKGQNFQRAIAKVSELGTTSFVMLMLKSRYDVGFTSDYQYHFLVAVADADGEVKAEKTFYDWEKEIPASNKYNVFDMHTEIYKMTLDKIINDPEIKAALTGG
ncbi:MAG: hypothetical protein KAH11_09855 [Rhodospirillales bacterium]|jgi:hypothetical protein|nr:hypothetical protein [Rhodospirillales bacterium]